MTIYLAPFNYHRVHTPLAGRLVKAWYVPGRLFSVNDATARIVPGLFARNERVILELAGERGPFVVILVSAGLRGFDEAQEQAAAGLGAGWPAIIWRVTLPLSKAVAGMPWLIKACWKARAAGFASGSSDNWVSPPSGERIVWLHERPLPVPK